ncbi:MoaD/ThiS family protein [Marinobacteraceae bacterium S3BR75-40.1]
MSQSTIRIRLFARLREAAGREGFDITVPEQGIAVGDMLRHETTASLLGTALTANPCLVAVNQAMAHAGDVIRAGDEVALFPPVTGG